MNDRLYRSVDDRVVAGVCGGLAARVAIDPSLVRIAYAVVALVTGIFPLLILYVIMAAVIPEEPTGFAGRSPAPPGPDAVPGWAPPASAGAAWPAAASAAPEWPAPGDAAPAAEPMSPVDAAGPSGFVDETVAAQPAPAPATWAAPPPRPEDRRADRPGGAMAGIVGGLVLVGLGTWFLVRDRLDVDWGVVWAAGLMALGVVVVLAAFRPRR